MARIIGLNCKFFHLDICTSLNKTAKLYMIYALSPQILNGTKLGFSSKSVPELTAQYTRAYGKLRELDIKTWHFPADVALRIETWLHRTFAHERVAESKEIYKPGFIGELAHFLDMAQDIVGNGLSRENAPIRYFAANSPCVEVFNAHEIDEKRVNAIVSAWQHTFEPFVLTACKLGNRIIIIDGAHRWYAAKLLGDNTKLPIYIIDVKKESDIVNVYMKFHMKSELSDTDNSEEPSRGKYRLGSPREKNKNPETEIPTDEDLEKYYLKELRKIYKPCRKSIELLAKKFPKSFSDAEKPQRPNLNIRNFTEELEHVKEIDNYDNLYDELCEANNWLLKQPDEYFVDVARYGYVATVKMLETARKRGFLLGLVTPAEIGRIIAQL